MITKFYKTPGNNIKNVTLLTTKNIDYIPSKGTFVWFSGQKFIVDEVHFNVDLCEYSLYLYRV